MVLRTAFAFLLAHAVLAGVAAAASTSTSTTSSSTTTVTDVPEETVTTSTSTSTTDVPQTFVTSSSTTTSTTTPTTTTTTLLPVDHYKCYKAKDLKTPPFTTVDAVSLADQFTAGDVAVKKLFTVCTPVSKNAEPIANETTHLCCYKVKASKLTPPRQVEVTSQFQASQVELKKAQLLCVPCTKGVLQ